MPVRSSEFDQAALWLEPILAETRSKNLVAITGPTGAGKSTLSRFLAWYFNTSLIEADHFLIPHEGFKCNPFEIDRIIKLRHNIQRSVIVEGATILQVLAKIKRVPNGIIQVRNSSTSRHPPPDEMHDVNPAAWGFEKCPLYEVVVAHNP